MRAREDALQLNPIIDKARLSPLGRRRIHSVDAAVTRLFCLCINFSKLQIKLPFGSMRLQSPLKDVADFLETHQGADLPPARLLKRPWGTCLARCTGNL